ncbi:MAG TPA: aminotransferase class I/II-fold pyridoxal phosphate-dependent enzyme [Vicinamibacteria bacterium]|nr:aminotransferase class I/II-fold pyridoxal phosphate-dependent enzyme [Vicinamibacteria bacterium]
MTSTGLWTRMVHAGEGRQAPLGRPVATPIYATAAFTYDSMEDVDKVFSGQGGDYVYTRHGNPTVAAFEEAMSILEDGEGACAYASGMAAMHAALFACDLTPGSTVLASQDLYGATLGLLDHVFAAAGVQTVTADFCDLDDVREKTLGAKPKALIAETLSNPLLKVCDLHGCALIAKEAGARLVVDNTFASPFLCQPLTLGADFVVHSATKYLSGHGDSMGGVVVARRAQDLKALAKVMKLVGGVLSVWEAHHLLRGIKTLGLRLERQCDNARQLAGLLREDARLARVHYPARSEAAASGLLDRVLRQPHAGALVSIELKDNTRAAAFRFMNALKLCVRLTSLGDVATGVSHSASSSHREVPPETRARLGITEGLVRISVGIEDVADLHADISQALAASVGLVK